MRLVIVRNPESPLLSHIDLDAPGQTVVLVQNAVFSAGLRAKAAAMLINDASAREVKLTDCKMMDYDGLLDEVLKAKSVLCI